MTTESPSRPDPVVRCVAAVQAVLGEGPVWVEREAALYWVDIKGRKIFRVDERGERREWATPFRVGSLAPRASGGFIGGTDEGIAEIDLEEARFTVITTRGHLPTIASTTARSTAAAVSGRDDGRSEKEATGTLYRVEPDLTASPIDVGYR